MRFAAIIRFLLLLIFALAATDQYVSGNPLLSSPDQEKACTVYDSESHSSLALIELQHGDDMISEKHSPGCHPVFIMQAAISTLVTDPVYTGPSACWQPPEPVA